jgi:hypothetical protein
MPTTDESAIYFMSLAGISDLTAAFSMPGNPGLGPYHPLNTFRSPFIPDRRKISWYFKTVVKIVGIKTGNRVDFVVNRESMGAAPDLILDADFVIKPVGSIVSMIRASVECETVSILQNFTPESAEVERAVSPFTTNDAPESFCGFEPFKISLPWFFTMDYNRHFPAVRLEKNSLIFSIELSGESDVELWLTVAYITPGEKKAVEESARAAAPLPAIVSSSMFVSDVLFGTAANTGDSNLSKCLAVTADSSIYALAWKCSDLTIEKNARYTLSITSMSGSKNLIEDVPDAFFKPSSGGWRIWRVAHGSDIWPPPSIGVLSTRVAIPGAGTFIFKATVDADTEKNPFKFCVIRHKPVTFDKDGAITLIY